MHRTPLGPFGDPDYRWQHDHRRLGHRGGQGHGGDVLEAGHVLLPSPQKDGERDPHGFGSSELVWSCGGQASLLVMRESPFSVGADNRTTKGDEAGSREHDEADGRQVSATSSVPAHCSRSTRSRSGPCTLSMPRCRSTGHHLASQRIISIMISSVSGCVSTDWVLIVLLAWHLLWRGYNRQQKEVREPAAAPCCSQHWNLGYVTLDPYY